MIQTTTTNQHRINRSLEKIDTNATLQYALLVAIMLLAAILRFYKIGEWGFWIDEIYTINRAVGDLGSIWVPLSTRLINIPLSILGIDEFSARLVPGILGILTIPILFFPVRKLTDGTTALLFAFLLALSPWHIYWSQNARFYIALMLFYTLAGICLFLWLESENPWYIVFSVVLIGLAMRENETALFIYPVFILYIIALYILPVERPAGLRWQNLVLFFIPMLIAGLLVVYSTESLFGFFTKILGHRHNPVRVFLSVISDVGLPLFLLAIFSGIYLLFQKSRLGLFLLISTLLPLLLLVIIAPFAQAFSRYVFQTLPFWIILGVIAVKAIIDSASEYGKFLALGIALMLVADSFSQDVLYFDFQNGNREDFKGAFEIVAQNKQPEDLIVSGWPEIGTYYLDEPVISSFEVKVKDVASTDHRVWFVVDNRSGFPGKLQKWIEANSQLVGVRDVYIPGKVLMMRVFLYQPGVP